MQYDPVRPSYDVMFVVKVPHAEQEPGTSSGIHMRCLDGHKLQKSADPEEYECDGCRRTFLQFMRQDTEMKWHGMKWYWCEPCTWCVCPECKEDIGFAIQFDNSIYEVHENVFVKGLRSTKGLIMRDNPFHLDARRGRNTPDTRGPVP